MKKTIWRPLVLGLVLGTVAGLTTAAGLSFLAPGITDNAIGIYATLFFLAAALGGPLAGAIASSLFVIITTFFGPPEVQEILRDPVVFWSNLLSLGIFVTLIGFAYRLCYERVKMPWRLLVWATLIIVYYAMIVPSSVIPQYLLHDEPASEILPAVLYGYEVYWPQAIFDIFITSLVFIALPLSYKRPLWYEPEQKIERIGEVPAN